METGSERYTFGMTELDDGIELIALALGLFGIAEFMNSVNQVAPINTKYTNVGIKRHAADQGRYEAGVLPDVARHDDRQPVRAHSRHRPDHRLVRCLCDGKEDLQTPEKFGTGLIEGVVCPEASTHSSVQGDFIPTMSLGIPGDAVMALLLGALMIQGIVPGPQLIIAASGYLLGPGGELLDRQHHAGPAQRAADRHLGEDAGDPVSLPLPERDVLRLHRRLRRQQRHVPGRRRRLVIGMFGYILLRLGFHPAPILLGFVLGPRFEENFRRAMLISRGDICGVRRAADQRRVRRAVRAPDRIANLFPAARRQGGS